MPLSKPRAIIGAILGKNAVTSTKSRNNKTSFRAVTLALAGTLGVGNIVGVASAIMLGGAGAVFWMWVSALLAMILKYGEVVLAMRHRRSRDGEHYGGAMYYMKDMFASCGLRGVEGVFTFVFTVLCLANGLGMGCMIQSGSISEALYSAFGVKSYISGALLMALCIIVFFFNGKKIFTLCGRLVPIASLLYILMSLVVIIKGYRQVPSVISEIIGDAFSFGSAGAGAFGFFTSRALRYGTIRGLFSNEAGCGTAPIAHATASTEHPSEQGCWGIFEVFADTVIVCTLTAFVILLNKECLTDVGITPMGAVIVAFNNSFGAISGALLAISVFLFAFATIVCWGYYGRECIFFLCRSGAARAIYFALYCIFVLVGALVDLNAAWCVADFAIGAMTVMNLCILLAMRGEIIAETKGYFGKATKKDFK